MKNKKGNILAAVVVVAVVAIIFLQTIFALQNRAARTHVRQSINDNMVISLETIQKKIEVLLTEKPSFFTRVLEGESLDKLHNDHEFTDVPGVLYKVRLSSHPIVGRLVMEISAKIQKSNETQAIRVVYDRKAIRRPFIGGSDNITIHWGRTFSRTPWMTTQFPRLFSSGAIPGVDESSDEPNTNDLNYWAYYQFDPLESHDNYSLDREYYKEKARKSRIPTLTDHGKMVSAISNNPADYPTMPEAIGVPAGSGLFPVTPNAGGDPQPWSMFFGFLPRVPGGTQSYTFRSSTSVFYFMEDDAADEYGGWVDVLISSYSFIECEVFMHDYMAQMVLDIESPGTGTVQATIPREANLEYQHPTAQPIWTAQVNGQPSMAQVWSEADRCCYPIDNVSFSGHISGEVCLDANAPIVLHGAFSGDCGFWGTDSSIYFDERATIHQLDWEDRKPVQISRERVNVPWE